MTQPKYAAPITQEGRVKAVEKANWLRGIMVDQDKGELYDALGTILDYETALARALALLERAEAKIGLLPTNALLLREHRALLTEIRAFLDEQSAGKEKGDD